MTLDHEHWVVEFIIKRGKHADFERLAREISENARRSEPGTRRYEWFLNKKENRCLVIESYDSSTSGLSHVKGEAVKALFPQILKIAKINSFKVCGEPSKELVEELADVGVKVYQFIAGFSR